NGKVSVRFDLIEGSRTVSDLAVLKQVSVLTHHHLQRVEVVVSTGTILSVPRGLILEEHS
ncbi:hypothetical protein PgNI_10922, partial [Pyricularia grisea]|uniref:Uncharacterized protein n=1 Tax=Pyricularia grisea TaxID=148305 RepID=A0A6P8AXI0_PYRGI